MINRELTKLYFETLSSMGIPYEAAVRYRDAHYVPQPKQGMFHKAARECDDPHGPDRVLCGGTRGQAKSHAVLAQVGIDDCARFPGLKVLYLRKIQKSAGEQFEDLILKIFQAVPHEYKPSKQTLYFPNGSRIIFGGFRSESEIDAYIGIEYDLIVLEDGTTLTESKYKMIEGSLRTPKHKIRDSIEETSEGTRDISYKPRMYISCNPGGVGHHWVKKLFYDLWKTGKETTTRFIHFQMGDNRFINPEYERYLNGLTGWLRRVWRDGDFEVSAGQYFTTFVPDKHVLDFVQTNIDWNFWVAKDYGNVHWNVTYLLGKSPTGLTYLLDEVSNRRSKVSKDAHDIFEMLGRWPAIYNVGEQITGWYCGHDIWTKKADEQHGQISVYDMYVSQGIRFEQAVTDRVQGALKMLHMFADDELYVHRNCQGFIERLPELMHDPNKGEDVKKEDCDPETGLGGDDFYDGARYGLMSKRVATGVVSYMHSGPQYKNGYYRR